MPRCLLTGHILRQSLGEWRRIAGNTRAFHKHDLVDAIGQHGFSSGIRQGQRYGNTGGS
jgi:hypothetical protein